MKKYLLMAGGLVIAGAVLTGCAVEAVAPSPTPTPSPRRPVATSTATGSALDNLTKRSFYADNFDLTIGCATGEVVIDQINATVNLVDSCAKVTMTGTNTVLVAEHIDTLVLTDTAVMSVVLVRSVDTLRVDGSMSEVLWDEGKPTSVVVNGTMSEANPNPTPNS